MKIKESIPSDVYKTILLKEKEREEISFMTNRTRYYPYFELQNGKLAIATVAVKKGKKKALFIKKVAVHILGNPKCYFIDIYFEMITGYMVYYDKEIKEDNGKRKVIKNLYTDDEWKVADNKYFRLFGSFEIINIEFLQRLEAFKYCAFDGNCDAFAYLESYIKNPKVELISKLIGSKYALKASLFRLAQKDKQFGQWLMKNSLHIRHGCYGVNVIIEAYKDKVSIDAKKQEHIALESLRQNTYEKDLWRHCKRTKGFLEKILVYIRKNKIGLRTYEDYFNACVYLGLDMSDSKNAFPNDWKYWREVRENQRATKKAELDKLKNKELDSKIKAIAQKYLSLAQTDNKVFTVIIADSKGSLVNEGDKLHHCVGRMDYDQRIIKETSLIFFIRISEQVDVPYVTVEFDLKDGTVKQCYGDNDSRPDKNTLQFVYEEWQPKARKLLNKIKKAQAA